MPRVTGIQSQIPTPPICWKGDEKRVKTVVVIVIIENERAKELYAPKALDNFCG